MISGNSGFKFAKGRLKQHEFCDNFTVISNGNTEVFWQIGWLVIPMLKGDRTHGFR